MVSSYNGAVSGLKQEINNGIFTDILLVKMFVFPHNTRQVRSLAASRRCRWREQKFAKVMWGSWLSKSHPLEKLIGWRLHSDCCLCSSGDSQWIIYDSTLASIGFSGFLFLSFPGTKIWSKINIQLLLPQKIWWETASMMRNVCNGRSVCRN